jgi:hypothetical protein
VQQDAEPQNEKKISACSLLGKELISNIYSFIFKIRNCALSSCRVKKNKITPETLSDPWKAQPRL